MYVLSALTRLFSRKIQFQTSFPDLHHFSTMPKGFAHIVLHASTPEDFESTANFYTTLGFTRLVDETDTDDERRVWLKLEAKDPLTSDITYKLTLTPSAKVNNEPPAHTDWSLEETGVVLPTDDIDVKADCFKGELAVTDLVPVCMYVADHPKA